MIIQEFHEQSFDWLTWRNGNLFSMLKVSNRIQHIVKNRMLIRRYAIGFCKSDNIPCRPKVGYIAVMFNTGENDWWTHFTMEEFVKCFPEVEI